MGPCSRGTTNAAYTPSDRSAFRWIAIAAFLTGMLYVFGPWTVRIQARSEELYIGEHLARGEGYMSPFSSSPDAPPTNWCPPIYPACVACVDRLAGIDTPLATAMLLIFAVLARTAAALGIFELARLGFGRGAGICGAALLMLHPLFYLMIGYYWDIYLSMAIFLWLAVAAVRMSRSVQPLRRLALLGAGLAVLSLTNSAYFFTFPLIVLAAAAKLQFRRRAMGVALAGIVFFAVLTPWTIRNYLVFHKLFFIRANAKVELWIGNQPNSDGFMTLTTLAGHPGSSATQRAEVLRKGEIAYSQEAGERFGQELRAAPGAFLRRCINRMRYILVLDPRTPGGIYTVLGASIVAGLAIAGLLFLGRWARWVWFTGWLAVLPYLVTHVNNRYSLPLAASSLIVAGAFVDMAIARCTSLCNGERDEGVEWGEVDDPVAETLPVISNPR